MSMKQQPKINVHEKCTTNIKPFKSPTAQSSKTIANIKNYQSTEKSVVQNNRYSQSKKGRNHNLVQTQSSKESNNKTPQLMKNQSQNQIFTTHSSDGQPNTLDNFIVEELEKLQEQLLQTTSKLSADERKELEQIFIRDSKTFRTNNQQNNNRLTISNSPSSNILRESLSLNYLGVSKQQESTRQSISKQSNHSSQKSISSVCYQLGIKSALQNIQPVQLSKNRRSREVRNMEKKSKEVTLQENRIQPYNINNKQQNSKVFKQSTAASKIQLLLTDIQEIKKVKGQINASSTTVTSPKMFSNSIRMSQQINVQQSQSEFKTTPMSQATSRINILEEAASQFMVKKKVQKSFTLAELRSKLGIRYLSVENIKNALQEMQNYSNDYIQQSITKEIFVNYMLESMMEKFDDASEEQRMIMKNGLKHIFKTIIADTAEKTKISIAEAFISLLLIKFENLNLQLTQEIFMFIFKSEIINKGQLKYLLDIILSQWKVFRPNSSLGKALSNIKISPKDFSSILVDLMCTSQDKFTHTNLYHWIFNTQNSKSKTPIVIQRTPLLSSRNSIGEQEFNPCAYQTQQQKEKSVERNMESSERKQYNNFVQDYNFHSNKISPTRPFLPHKDLSKYAYFNKNIENNHQEQYQTLDHKVYEPMMAKSSTPIQAPKRQSNVQQYRSITSHKHTQSQYSQWKREMNKTELSTERLQYTPNSYMPKIHQYQQQTLNNYNQPQSQEWNQFNTQSYTPHQQNMTPCCHTQRDMRNMYDTQQFYMSQSRDQIPKCMDNTQFYSNNNISSSCVNCLLSSQSHFNEINTSRLTYNQPLMSYQQQQIQQMNPQQYFSNIQTHQNHDQPSPISMGQRRFTVNYQANQANSQVKQYAGRSSINRNQYQKANKTPTLMIIQDL